MGKKTKFNQIDLIHNLKVKYDNKHEYYLIKDELFRGINSNLEGKCLVHNHNFYTTFNKANKYNPCRKCANEKLSSSLINHEKIKSKIIKCWGEKTFDLSKIEEYNFKNKLKLKCNKHNFWFENKADAIINQKIGCPKCSKENRKTKHSPADIISKFKLVKNTKYNYSEIEKLQKINTNDKLPIICPEHGLFYQNFHSHLKSDCPKCHRRNLSIEEKLNNLPYKDKFSYDVENNFKAKDKIKIKCLIHNYDFEQTYNDHQQGHTGCPKCYSSFTKINDELKEFIENISTKNNIKVEFNNRKILDGKEIDIYFPDLNFGIEFNGDYWHSNEILKNKKYHLEKTNICNIKNINLFHIWENDWINKKDIVKSMILNKLNITINKIHARKCIIKEISPREYSNFLLDNHLQGNVNSKIKLGLFYNNVLVSVMGFGGLRKNLGYKSKEGSYELLRFCNKLNTVVIGGASKLFHHFIKFHNPENVISYADRDHSVGNLYEKLGFKFIKNTDPNYWYILNSKKINRFSMRKDVLVKKGANPLLSEKQIISQYPNIKTIYNSGNKKYEYTYK